MNPQKTGNLISKLRKEKELTQKELAEMLKVTSKAISRWETGKGYPDIEILPELSNALGISVNELLNGELLPKTPDHIASEEKIVYICNDAAVYRRKSRKKIIWLSIGFGAAAFLMLLSIVFILHSAISLMTSIDPNCVIAKDYSYIVYNNEKYIPLNTKGYTLLVGDEIVSEATVEGEPAISKLLFGDSIFAVDGTEDNSVIILRSDYDDNPSDYYVKESEADRINGLIDSFCESEVYCMSTPFASFGKDELTSPNSLTDAIFWQELFALPSSCEPDSARIESDIIRGRSVSVVVSDESGLLYKSKGKIITQDDKYYWIECSENSFDIFYSYMYSSPLYLINSEYYDDLEALFLSVNYQ